MNRDVKCMQRQIELDGTESNIEILSELRAQFNCFDKQEEPVYRALSDAISALKGWWSYPLPAQPERKTGRWKRRIVDSGYNADWICSECGYRVKTDFVNYNFCPNCGADMRGEQDG